MDKQSEHKGTPCLKRNAALALKFLLILLPVAWGVFVVWKYGVNAAYWDEYRFFENKEHFLSPGFLWAPHNEHRMLFPKLLAWLVGSLSGWNSKAFMYTSQLMLLIVYIILIWIVLQKRKFRDINRFEAVGVFFMGISVYNAAQYENMLWGFQTAWMMIAAFGSLSFFAFDRYLKTNRIRYLTLAMVSAVITTFSSFHGLAVWGGYLAVLLIRFIRKEKLSLKACITVGTTCVISVFLYFFKWSNVQGHAGLAGQDPIQITYYLLREIGESVLSSSRTFNPLVASLGFVLLGLFLFQTVEYLLKKQFISHIAYIGPMILGLGAMLFVAMGRASSGIIFSRYNTNSMVFLTFFLAILTEKVREGGSRRFIHAARFLLIGLFALLVLRNTGMQNTLADTYNSRMEIKRILVNYENLGLSDYQKLHPMEESEVDHWRSVFNMMKEEKLNAFSDDISDDDNPGEE